MFIDIIFNPMLKKENRLGKTSEIQKILSKGKGVFNPFFTIKFLPSSNEKKFTVVVSVKVFKKAVARNRLKRIVREYLRKNLKALKNGSYIIIARPKINSTPEKHVIPAFAQLLAKIR